MKLSKQEKLILIKLYTLLIKERSYGKHYGGLCK